MNRELKALIILKFGSQFEFARVMREHESNVSKVIRGRKTLTPEDRRLWAKKLGCSPESIFKDLEA